MCRRTHCPDCDEEMIHRDNRKFYESASAFGQIIYRTMPRTFTFGDIDSYYFKRTMRLLRLIEHKQPHQTLRAPQWEALDILARAVDAYIPTGELHPDSGLYVIRGELGPAVNGHRATHFLGPQIVYRSIDLTTPIAELATSNDLRDWMHA